MHNGTSKTPHPQNESVLNYLPDSNETKILKEQLISFYSSSDMEIPAIINGKEVLTGDRQNCVMPHEHAHTLAAFHKVGKKEVQLAIDGAKEAQKEWSLWAPEARMAVFLKAGELLSGKYRAILNAATMLGQSKTCYQAEIDAACELIDFFRFNVRFAEEIYSNQPYSARGVWNQLEYRPLEGFVFAVTPFNFTSIGGNLPTAPVLMGNVALWKPASTSVFSNYFIMKLLEEAGLPPGVIQFLPGNGSNVGDVVFKSREFAGLHFTGSTVTFNSMWQEMAGHIQNYRSYPRIVGETGGKDFVIAHSSSDVSALRAALIRGAYEYQGQKCSAASRAYIPKSIWPSLKEELIAEIKTIKMGDVSDFSNFMSSVIDKKSFNNIKGYIDGVKSSSDARLICGGECDDSTGYFIEPTLIEVSNPKYKTMCEEIFGPVLTVYPYDDKNYEEVLKLCDETSPYALTGCVFSQDRSAILKARSILTHCAGNFYINNKPTGAVVGQQPFGGSRGSGTNDKAGSFLNLLRWVSARTVSETFAPPLDYRYPFMAE